MSNRKRPHWGSSTIRVKFQVAAMNVRKRVKPACVSHSDFCSGFGTVFQGVHRVFTLFGHYQEARAKSTHLALTPEVGLEMVGISRVFSLHIYQCLTVLIWNYARFVLNPLVLSTCCCWRIGPIVRDSRPIFRRSPARPFAVLPHHQLGVLPLGSPSMHTAQSLAGSGLRSPTW
jgi:hypothetical protein